jgi:hypothetical protein
MVYHTNLFIFYTFKQALSRALGRAFTWIAKNIWALYGRELSAAVG